MNYLNKEEMQFVNSLNKPIENINMDLINSIINKMIKNKDNDNIIWFLEYLNDFAKIPKDFVDNLIKK